MKYHGKKKSEKIFSIKFFFLIGIVFLGADKAFSEEGPHYPLKFKIEKIQRSSKVLEFGLKLQKAGVSRREALAQNLHHGIKQKSNLLGWKQKAQANHQAKLNFFEIMRERPSCPRDLRFLTQASGELAQHSGSPGEIVKIHDKVLSLFAQGTSRNARAALKELEQSLNLAVEKTSKEISEMQNDLQLEEAIWDLYTSLPLNKALEKSQDDFFAFVGEFIEEMEWFYRRAAMGEKSAYWRDPDTKGWLEYDLDYWQGLKNKEPITVFRSLRLKKLL